MRGEQSSGVLRWDSEFTLSRQVQEGFLEEVMLKLNLRMCRNWRERRKGRDLSLAEEAVHSPHRQERRWHPVCSKCLINILKIKDSGVFSLRV